MLTAFFEDLFVQTFRNKVIGNLLVFWLTLATLEHLNECEISHKQTLCEILSGG